MRISRLQQVLALALVVLTAEGGCIILPEVKSKIVELVASATACDTLDASGLINNLYDEKGSFDIKAGVDFQEIADAAGVSLDDIDTVYVSGVTYMVTEPDPEPTREISNGNVTVQRGNLVGTTFTGVGPVQTIITNFSVVVNTVTTDTTAPVDAAGIQLIEQLVNECLKEAKGTGPPVTNTAIEYTLSGQSLPQDDNTSFMWRICVSLNMPAPTEVDVIE